MEYFLMSKAGGRPNNEDSADCFRIKDKDVFVLADGLGGHKYGEVASQEAIGAVRSCFENFDGELEEMLTAGFKAAHQKLKTMQEQVGNSSFFKTTLVVLIATESEVLWGHIGDSRIYHFEDGQLIERSMDHSVPQMLVNAGKIRESKIRGHEDRSRLLKVLGAEEENSVPYVSVREPRNEKSVFLLCSDGFWELIDERHMMKELKKADSPEDWLNAMEKTVLKNGRKKEMDNYSAIGIFL